MLYQSWKALEQAGIIEISPPLRGRNKFVYLKDSQKLEQFILPGALRNNGNTHMVADDDRLSRLEIKVDSIKKTVEELLSIWN